VVIRLRQGYGGQVPTFIVAVACAVLSAWRELLLLRLCLLVSLQKWICQAFPADRCRRAMAGEHSHIIAQRK
jgi:hypothetical protein